MKAGFHCRGSLTILVCAALTPTAMGVATLHVGGRGEKDFKTIQEAVDVAIDGDIIVLSSGTYTGQGNCDVRLRGKAITIESVNPLDPNSVAETIIDCAGSQEEPHRAFYIIDCDGLVLSGLTITRGLAVAGGAVYCQNTELKLTHCRILDNAALPGDAATDLSGGPGGGLYCEKSVVKVTECLFRGNAAGRGVTSKDGPAGVGGNGGAICSEDSDLSVVSCTISHNRAGAGGDNEQAPGGNGGEGGGICADSIHIVDSTLLRNTAGTGGQGVPSGHGGRGGGVYSDTATIDRCTVEANRAGDGGKTGARAKDNRGSGAGDGGGIYGSQSLKITNSLVVANRAGREYVPDAAGWLDHGDGGGVWCAAGTIRQCTIAANVVCQSEADAGKGLVASAGRGAGVFCTPKATILSSIVYANTPDQLAGHDCNNIHYCNIDPALCSSGADKAFIDALFVQSGRWLNADDLETAAKPDDPNAIWTQGDYHLKTTSPLLDAGDPNYVPGLDETDRDGSPRLADAAVDVGAYESDALTAVYRFWSPAQARHFYAVGGAERDKLISEQADVWTFEGRAFYVYTRAVDPNLRPVYRLWSKPTDSYFYTINESERDKLIRQYPLVWKLEGTAFYAYPAGRQSAGTKPVYRFWSGAIGTHFFTIRESEKDKLIKSYANVWAFEGVAWYAYESRPGELTGPSAAVYDFSGGILETLCTVSLKAFLDGKEAKIDNPDITYTAQNGYMKMTVDLKTLKTALNEFLTESTSASHTATIGGNGAGSTGIPIVLSTNVMFWGRTPRGPYDIDPKNLTFPTSGSSLAGSNEAFTIDGTVTVEGRISEIDVVGRATRFATGDPAVFDTSGIPDRLNARMYGTFEWSRQKQDLLFQTTVKGGSELRVYVTSARIETTGVWQGKLSP